MHHIMECIQKFQALNQQLKNIKQEAVKNRLRLLRSGCKASSPWLDTNE